MKLLGTEHIAPKCASQIARYAAMLCILAASAQASAQWGNFEQQLEETLHQSDVQPKDLHLRELLDPERSHANGSLSKGSTSAGSLLHGAYLPSSGPHHFVFQSHRDRPTHWGSDELVQGLLRAAQTVFEQFQGGRLGVGNISLENGGRLKWSVSHNSGRDADLSFYFLDEKGQSIEASGLVRVGNDGLSVPKSRWKLDVPRTWALVEALVLDQEMRVQWLFASEAIQKQLLDYAVSIGTETPTIDAARSVLRQPTAALPHNDHLHVRVHCAKDDRIDGCIDWSPKRSHLSYPDEEVVLRTQTLLQGFLFEDEQTAAQSLELLHILEPKEAVAQILHGLQHAEDRQQAQLFSLLASIGGNEVERAFLRFVREEKFPAFRLTMMRALAGFASLEAVPLLLAVALNADEEEAVRLAGLQALTSFILPATFDALHILLDNESEALQQRAATILSRNMLLEFSSNRNRWSREYAHWKAKHAVLLAEQSFEGAHLQWVQAAFQHAGYRIGSAESPNYGELLKALSDPNEALAWNADRLLVHWSGVYSSSKRFDAKTKTRYWNKVLQYTLSDAH